MSTRAVRTAVHDSVMRRDIGKARERLEKTLQEMTPVLAPSVSSWMTELSGTPQPEDYFLHPEAFPMFLLPYWFEKATAGKSTPPFRRDLIYSTMNGYYFIRLMDNVMDGDGDASPLLLPAMQIFHLEYIQPYTKHFPARHPFWKVMRKNWFRSAEAVMHDALLADMDAAQFQNIAAQKVCAAKIPIAAVGHYYERHHLIREWNDLIDLLGCWHQMLNDVFDWRKDMTHENSTYFLSEARRRARRGETTAEWVYREGLEWAIERLDEWMDSMQAMTAARHSSGLSTYLRTRRALLRDRIAEMADPMHAIQRLVAAIRSDS